MNPRDEWERLNEYFEDVGKHANPPKTTEFRNWEALAWRVAMRTCKGFVDATLAGPVDVTIQGPMPDSERLELVASFCWTAFASKVFDRHPDRVPHPPHSVIACNHDDGDTVRVSAADWRERARFNAAICRLVMSEQFDWEGPKPVHEWQELFGLNKDKWKRLLPRIRTKREKPTSKQLCIHRDDVRKYSKSSVDSE